MMTPQLTPSLASVGEMLHAEKFLDIIISKPIEHPEIFTREVREREREREREKRREREINVIIKMRK